MENAINLGIMVDVSRGSVLNIPSCKRLIDYLANINYKTLMFYTEDVYEIPEEPYFGYLRGRYSQSEIKELDSYAKTKGIELVPCIQTLAHLNGIVRWEKYRPITDVHDILLADDDRTYELIDLMFKSLSSCFSTKKLHIGMDEAHMVGLGRYLDLHGYQNRTDILLKHLQRVCDIAKKYGFEPIMWSDMFFRLATKGGYNPATFSDEIKELIPEGLGLVYWDYYSTTKKRYEEMLDSHLQFKKRNPTWFATGGWNWRGFVPCNKAAINRVSPALEVCKEKNIENIFTTLWGDDGGECSPFPTLPVLYYTMAKRYGKENDPNFKEQFNKLTGEDYDAMLSLSLPNEYEQTDNTHPVAKVLFYQDPFLALFDTYVKDDMDAYYKTIAQKYNAYAKTSKNFSYLFHMEETLCNFLSIKATIGHKTRVAYKTKDVATLQKLANEDYPEAIKRLEEFYDAYKTLWFTDFKPFGWELEDMRLGGLKQRLQYCKGRLEEYLNNKIKTIEELDEEILPYSSRDGIPEEQLWQRIITPFQVSH